MIRLEKYERAVRTSDIAMERLKSLNKKLSEEHGKSTLTEETLSKLRGYYRSHRIAHTSPHILN